MADMEPLAFIAHQLEPANKAQLDAGFGLLVKDYARYLESHPRDDAGGFWRVYRAFSEEETAGYGGSPFFQSAAETGVPAGLAEKAAAGEFDVAPLLDPSIEHEWLMIPGQRLLRRFAAEFKEVICGDGGPYQQFKNGLVGQEELPKVIAASVLAAGFSIAVFWYPLVVYIGLLLVKAGLATYCKTGGVGHVG